jgi:LuxR family maltose regulon positive regulatory protein
MAYRSQGLYEQAAQAFGQEVQMFAAPEDILGWTIATLEVAVVRRLQGRLHQSEAIARQMLKRFSDLGISPSGALSRVHLALGEVLREYNDLDEARRRVSATVESMRSWNMPTDRLAAQLSLLRVLLAQNDLPAAQECLRVAKELRASAPVFLDLSRSLDILEVRLALLQQDFDLASALMDNLQPGTSQIVFLREQELTVQARLCLAQDRPGEALTALGTLAEAAKSAGRLYAWLEIQVLQALALDAKGDRQAALAVLDGILGFAAREGFVRVFIDEGAAMRDLLSAAARQGQAGANAGYLTKLLDSFPAEQKPDEIFRGISKWDGLVEPLTARELEVLQLIAAGDSNQTIAEKLVITVSAVKKHSGNIFAKLNVSSRTQAVARAGQLGLITLNR